MDGCNIEDEREETHEPSRSPCALCSRQRAPYPIWTPLEPLVLWQLSQLNARSNSHRALLFCDAPRPALLCVLLVQPSILWPAILALVRLSDRTTSHTPHACAARLVFRSPSSLSESRHTHTHTLSPPRIDHISSSPSFRPLSIADLEQPSLLSALIVL